MYCDNCKFLNHAFGNYWCEKGNITDVVTNNGYPCGHFEPLNLNPSISVASFELSDIIVDSKMECIKKASRLAESILMDWDKEQQIELAKEVASMTHNIIFTEDENKV